MMITPASEIIGALEFLMKQFNHSAEWYIRNYPKDNYCGISVKLKDGTIADVEIINQLLVEINKAGYYVTKKYNPFADCGYLLRAYYSQPKNWFDKVFNYND